MKPRFSSARCCCSSTPIFLPVASVAYGKSEGTAAVDAVDAPGPSGDFARYYRQNVIAGFGDLFDCVWLYDWTTGLDPRFPAEVADDLKREYVVLVPFVGQALAASNVTVDVRVILLTARSAVAPGFTYEIYGLKQLLTSANIHPTTLGFDTNFTAADLTTAKVTQAFPEVVFPGPAATTINATAIVNEVTSQFGYDPLQHYVCLIARPTGTFYASPYSHAARAEVVIDNLVFTP